MRLRTGRRQGTSTSLPRQVCHGSLYMQFGSWNLVPYMPYIYSLPTPSALKTSETLKKFCESLVSKLGKLRSQTQDLKKTYAATSVKAQPGRNHVESFEIKIPRYIL